MGRVRRCSDMLSRPTESDRGIKVRNAVYDDVMHRVWNPERKSFVQSNGSDALDASNLLMPLTFFMAPNDPRMLATVDAIRKPVAQGGLAANGLVYRYLRGEAHDGLSGDEGTFTMCSFWLIEALTRAGRTDPR